MYNSLPANELRTILPEGGSKRIVLLPMANPADINGMSIPTIRPEKSALQVFLRVLAVIFLAEGSVMLLLEFVLPKMPDLVEAAFDATQLSLIATPFLWGWLVVSDRERRQAEQELQRTNESLHAANLELERTTA